MENTMESMVGGAPTAAEQASAARPTPVSGSTDPREFLMMRARQRVVRRRRRRWKLAGLTVVVGTVMAVGLTAPRRHRDQHALRPASAPALLASEAPVEVVHPVNVATVEAALGPDLSAACDQEFSTRQWRGAIDACTRAFESTPGPLLALRVAHAQWSHGHAADAGLWASKALALGSNDPDAFVLVGHAERQAGHSRAALAAYRRYLRLAPHGWNAPRVRAAVRRLAPRSDSSGPALSSAD
jgi:Flp pilus assembly protein TadD